eukprot:COSAG01_NODE_1552_length_9933_cov_13.631483_16_plen_64_part_00
MLAEISLCHACSYQESLGRPEAAQLMANDHLETEQLEHQRQLLQAKRAERQREANVRLEYASG